MYATPDDHQQPSQEPERPSSSDEGSGDRTDQDHNLPGASIPAIIPAFERGQHLTPSDIRGRFREACAAWLARSPSMETRTNYTRDLQQFLHFVGIPHDHIEQLATVRPPQVAAWRDELRC